MRVAAAQQLPVRGRLGDGVQQDLPDQVVAARRDGDADLQLGRLVHLGEPPHPRRPARGRLVAGAEQAALDELVQVEGCQTTGDADGAGRLVAAERVLAADQAVQAAAERVDQQRDDRQLAGREGGRHAATVACGDPPGRPRHPRCQGTCPAPRQNEHSLVKLVGATGMGAGMATRLREAKRPVSLLAGPYGHPLHPVLVTVPIGAWVASFVFDLASRFSGEPVVFAKGAWWLIVVGLVGAAAAAMLGFLDLFAIPTGPRAFRTGLLHMALNLTVVAVFAGSLLLRRGRLARPGGVSAGLVALSAVALAVLAVSG
jgi:uncharacterized membrane protein